MDSSHIPEENKYKFQDRAQALVNKWSTIAVAPSSETINTNGVENNDEQAMAAPENAPQKDEESVENLNAVTSTLQRLAIQYMYKARILSYQPDQVGIAEKGVQFKISLSLTSFTLFDPIHKYRREKDELWKGRQPGMIMLLEGQDI